MIHTPLAFLAIFDPAYLLLVGPFILLSIFAAMKVRGTFARMHEVPAFSGLTGAQVAREILLRNGLKQIVVEQTPQHLGDHYSPDEKTIRLSPEVYNGTSVAALGVAAHECGHALQDKDNYGPLKFRSGMMPLAMFGSQAWVWLLLAGFLLGGMAGSGLGQWLVLAGIGLFSVVVLLQLVTLPVEFNASARARRILVDDGFIAPQENRAVGSVLNAAAWTYVAAALTAVATLLYYLLMFAGNRGEE